MKKLTSLLTALGLALPLCVLTVGCEQGAEVDDEAGIEGVENGDEEGVTPVEPVEPVEPDGAEAEGEAEGELIPETETP